MTSRWQWLVRLLLRRIWFRAALFSLLAVGLALLAAFVAPLIPYDIGNKIGSEAVDHILGILASSMLAVTTFSLATMVSAYAGASSTLTPRATQLLVEDATAQNALSTFLGAFLFAIVGICALSTGIYGQAGRTILFAGTILVIVIIVLTLLRWIEHLSSFGRVGNTIDRVESVTLAAIRDSGFGVRLTGSETPATGRGVCADSIGYVTHIDLSAIEALACRRQCPIDIRVTPGTFVTPQSRLAQWQAGDDSDDGEVRDAFTIEHHRQFDHDPRFGLVVLSEIASRALSPAVNDPGTAIAVLGAGVRVMTCFLATPDAARDEPSAMVRLPGFAVADLIDDLIDPIARDGAGMVEVAVRLQQALAEIAALVPAAQSILAAAAAQARDRCNAAMGFAPDLQRVRAMHQLHWGTDTP